MFVKHSLALAVPLAVVQHRLLEYLHAGDLDSLASAAYHEGATILARAGVGGLAKAVEIQSVPAYQRGTTIVVPFRWMATGALSGAFPVLDANLELAATSSGTDLVLVGSYRPPLGPLGAAIDRLVMHAVAEATVRRFASQLGDIAAGKDPAPAVRPGELGPQALTEGDA